MLDNPFGMYIAWGNDYTHLYNDDYRPILGDTKHPQVLGISTRETFSEVWHIIGSMFDGVMILFIRYLNNNFAVFNILFFYTILKVRSSL